MFCGWSLYKKPSFGLKIYNSLTFILFYIFLIPNIFSLPHTVAAPYHYLCVQTDPRWWRVKWINDNGVGLVIRDTRIRDGVVGPDRRRSSSFPPSPSGNSCFHHRCLSIFPPLSDFPPPSNSPFHHRCLKGLLRLAFCDV